MINNPDGDLHVYMLSVGQADTSVIVTPQGRVVVIDATRPTKLLGLLGDLGLDGTVEHLVLTHPHNDHFSAGNRLAQDLIINEAMVAPFWHEFGMGPPTYRKLIVRLRDRGTNTTFLSGYSRWYPDGALTRPADGSDPELDPDKPFLELLGPNNGLVRQLEEANVFNTNHLSIMTRLTWHNFRMISTGDAQMENWDFFDRERLMRHSCQVLRAAHHGSPNGTQWERINRLSPSQVIVSSDPGSGHHLPDVTATAIFTKFDSENGQMAVITLDTGTIHLTVNAAGTRTLECFHDTPSGNVDLNNGTALTEVSNPTDWAGLLAQRVADL
ncbi:MAG: ComEC/Rec2 family competence protein [Planctomycetota bacterium]|jgi:competence protein ComEC